MSAFRTHAPIRLWSLRRNKKLRPRNRLDIHGNTPATKAYGTLDKRFSIRGKYPQIRYFRINAGIRTEIAAQPLRPDIAGPPHVFVLAGLAIGPLPAVSDRAVKYAAKERDLVEKQAFYGVQGGHEIEAGA